MFKWNIALEAWADLIAEADGRNDGNQIKDVLRPGAVAEVTSTFVFFHNFFFNCVRRLYVQLCVSI